MHVRRRILVGFLLTFLLVLLLSAGIVLAQEPNANEPVRAQAAVGSAFTYQGRLVRDGNPVNDTCDFQFDLFAQASGGSSLQTVQKNNHPVTDGRFTVDLGFAASHFTGDARWLEVAVKCSGDSSSQTLGRQRLRPAPYAMGLKPGATVAGTLNNTGVISLTNKADDGLRVESAAGDGVQVTSANYGLYVNNANVDGLLIDSAGNDGVYVGQATSDGVYVGSANYGVSVASSDADGIFVNNADADGDGFGIAGYFDGDVRVTEYLTATNLYAVSKNFVIDHPQDPENKLLYHSSVESPDRMNVYNGNVILDENGEAQVQLPDYFEALNRDFRYQLTPIGGPGPNLYIAQEVQNNTFRIAGGEPGLKVSWQVTGIRDDASARANPMQVEVEKPGDKQGTYLDPEAYGQPGSKGMHAAERTRKEGSK